MKARDKFRIYMKFIRIEIRERLVDLAMIALPIFTVTGLIAISAKFWIGLLGL